MINGANSLMVARITNRTPHEEASPTTRSFDVVRCIRARRLRWVGHILRMDPSRMVHKALRHIHESRRAGDLLMDTPPALTWRQLKDLAAKREVWRHRVHSLRNPGNSSRNGTGVTVIINPSLPGCISTHHHTSRPLVIPKTTTRMKSPRAQKYVCRDTHEAFFRPGAKGKRKRDPCRPGSKKAAKQRKRPYLTDKQRAKWAREHYELHHGPPANSHHPSVTSPTTLVPFSPPSILGHHRQSQLNLNDTIDPPDFHLFLHSPEVERRALQDFIIIIDLELCYVHQHNYKELVTVQYNPYLLLFII